MVKLLRREGFQDGRREYEEEDGGERTALGDAFSLNQNGSDS
jgi:hypothetical protein